MAEYWVSKKQYWCKYCNIWVRDDAPSRRLHETGLKHQGQKERFIRELYKGGERAKKEKESEARQYARIEAAAKAAHSKDGGSYTGRIHHGAAAAAASSSRLRPKESKDKWSNYSTASQMGFEVDESEETAFSIEQMVRGRDTKVGAWQEVKVPTPSVTYDAEGAPVIGAKRKIEDEEEEADSFKFERKEKKPVRDPYDEDDWDPSALGTLKFKGKGKANTEKDGHGEELEPQPGPDIKQESKAEIKEEDLLDRSNGKVVIQLDGEVKQENADTKEEIEPGPIPDNDTKQSIDVKPDVSSTANESPAPETPSVSQPTQEASSAGASGLFKKRRPPPSNRKK